MRVLLVKTSSMGDIVHALPVVADILAAYPEARIDWLVEESYAPLVLAHPGVVRVIPLALRRWRKHLLRAETRQQWRALVDSLCVQAFDVVIDLQGLVKSATIARLARGPHVGLSWASSREALAPLFYDRRMKSPLHRTEAAVRRYRELAGWALHYTPAGPPRYGLKVQAQRPAWLPGQESRPYAVLLSATAKERKLWSEDRWVELAGELGVRGTVSVFAWGNGAERERAQRLVARVNTMHAEDCALVAPEAFGLDAWMQVLAAAALVVGVDTGLLYLGAAVGTPAVAIYTGSSPQSVEFESEGPWRSLGDDGRPPEARDVMAAILDLLALPQRGETRASLASVVSPIACT